MVDWLPYLLAALSALSVFPAGLMLGSSCSPCCSATCGRVDGKPRTDPKNEGTWTPSGTWLGAGGVTWTFTANPGNESGNTWFFYGSPGSSNSAGSASLDEQRDWNNICNWYSNKTSSPSVYPSLGGSLDKRATRLPPSTATVHIYSDLDTNGSVIVKNAYIWNFAVLRRYSYLTATDSAHDTTHGVVLNNSTKNSGLVGGGALFNSSSNNATLMGGEPWVDGGATFNNTTYNVGRVNGGATFNSTARCLAGSSVYDGATLNNSSYIERGASVYGGATFNNTSYNDGSIGDGAIFNNDSENRWTVSGGATFNDNSYNLVGATVNGGATFNDAACTRRTRGVFAATPCTRLFVTHDTDLPTCNGTAPNGCNNAADTCGCG